MQRKFPPKNELIDKQINYLTLKEHASIKKGLTTRSYWKCICICGKQTLQREDGILKGRTQSCGCKSREIVINKIKGDKNYNWKGYGELSKNFYSLIIHSAKYRNIHFELSMEYLWNLFLKQDRKCAISGLKLELTTCSRSKERKLNTASLDRIDSLKSYIEGNVQWVHKTINKMKCQMVDQDFIAMCKIVADHHN